MCIRDRVRAASPPGLGLGPAPESAPSLVPNPCDLETNGSEYILGMVKMWYRNMYSQ